MFICIMRSPSFFFNDTATPDIYTLSLHDALPISPPAAVVFWAKPRGVSPGSLPWITGCCGSIPEISKGSSPARYSRDRKSTRLNSSHVEISYAVFCLKKKKNKKYYCHHTTYFVVE